MSEILRAHLQKTMPRRAAAPRRHSCAEEQETLREVEDLVRRQDWTALRTRLEPLAPSESVARILDALATGRQRAGLGTAGQGAGRGRARRDVRSPAGIAGRGNRRRPSSERRRPARRIAARRSRNANRSCSTPSSCRTAACARSRSTARRTWPPPRRSGWTCSPRRRRNASWIEDIFGLELPDADDLKDLEESARFYIEDNGDVHLHSDFLLDKEDESRNVAVAFVLHNNILFSMRDEELPVFRLQRLRARIQPGYVTDGKDVLLDLYDADVEYSADALEDIYAELEKVSRTVLTPQVTDDEAAEILSDIAKEEDLNGRIRRNVLDTRRALSFLMRSRLLSTDQYDDARQILRDIDSLDGHTSFLFGKINFLMDATVGFININQNKRVSKLTTISVVFVPLNIIAGIGGMSEFSMMTQGVPWPLSYGAFMVAMGLFGWGTFVTLRWLETRKARKLLAARRAGREG
jgi:magnesium/cobalt transport protein CorA